MIPFTPDERRAQFAPSQNVGGPVDPDILDIIGERPQPTMAQQVEYEVPEVKPVDPDVLDIVNKSQGPMMASLMGASRVNPDQAAEAKRLGSQIGVGQDIALRNLEDVRKRAFMADIQRRDIARANPVLAGFLSDPTFANEASDDIGALEQIGSFFADVGRAVAGQPLQYIPMELARGYMRGQRVAERGEIGTRAITQVIMGETPDINLERAKQIQEEMRGLSGGGILASTAEVVAQNVAQAREVVGTGLIGGAAGSVIPGLGTMAGFAGGIGTGVVLTTGKIEAGNMYLDMKEQGINDDTAIPVALGAGLLNGVIEAVGMKIAAAPFRQLASRVMREQIAEAVRKPTMRAALAQAGKAYAMQVGTEATEEGLQEIVNIAGEELAKGMEGIDSETTMRDAAKRVLDSFVQGAMGSAILGGIGPGANLYVDLRRAGKATKQTQFFNDLSQNATASKLKARDAGAYERFVAATADGTGADTVFVDGATMRDVLSQAGVTDAQLEAIVPGLAQQVRQATEQGNDVTIPTAQFAARLAGTKLGDGLLPHMRLSPDAMSATEAQQFEQNREALVEEARALLESKTEAESAFVQEADQVATTMRERLIAAGRDPALAEVESLVHQAFVVTQAARQGKTPAQFEAESGLREIVGAEMPAAPLEQANRDLIASVDVELGRIMDAAKEESRASGKTRSKDTQAAAKKAKNAWIAANPERYKEYQAAQLMETLENERVREAAALALAGKIDDALATAAQTLTDAGFVLDYESPAPSKSRYYRKGNTLIRLSDHEIPVTPERAAAREAGVQVPYRDFVFDGTAVDAELIQDLEAFAARTTPNIMEQAARAQYPALAKAWNRYNTGEEIQTPQDLADSMESLVEDGRAPESIAEAVRQYRDAQAFDIETKGRGELDAAGDALEIAVQQAAEQMRPTPNIMEQAARGPARGGYDPSRLKILFGKGADFTTGAHELTHYYVDYYTKQALAGTAAPQMLADLDIMFKFMGVAGATLEERLAAFNAMPFETSRPLIETITYNAEIYLFEGKAPSLELAGVFDRMLAFFRRAYKSIADFVTQQREIYRREFGRELPELSDELRQVFDRMLADERQIKQAQAVSQMRGQFTVKPEGMDDAEWAAYQEMAGEATNAAIADMTKASLRQMKWLSRARSPIIKDMQARHTAQRKEVRERVKREVQQDPLYRAMAFLRRGQVVAPDGTVTEAEGVHRIDRVLAAEFAPTVDLARLGGRFGVLQDDGLHPDIVAEMFGFPAGASLLQALADAKPMREVVEDRTDAEMLRLYGDMNTPEAREQEIQKALHNEARARLVGVELRFMGKIQQPVRVLLEAARQAAQQAIGRRRIVEIRPSEFVAAEAKAAREALTIGEFADPSTVAQTASTRAYKKAMEDGLTEADAADRAMQAGLKAVETQRAKIAEFESRYAGLNREQIIVRAKRAQLLNNQLAKAALEAKDEIDNGVRYLRRVLRDDNRKRMGADVADQIASLLDRFNIAPMTADEARRVGTLAEFLATLEDRGLVPDIAESIGMRDTRIPYKNMTVTEFRDLVDAVKQLEYIGKNERKILLAKEKAEFESVRDQIVASVIENAGDRKANARTATTNIGRAVTAMKGFAAAHLKAASIVRILDGGKDGGPLWNYLIRSANDAGDSETSMRAEATADLTKILEPVFRAGKLGGKGVVFPTIKRAMNREARLVVALNMGNAGNMQRLLDGEGWSIEAVMPVLQSLTEDELNTVQQIWDYFEKYRPMIGQKERRLYGKEPAWVDPQPLVVRSADGKTITLRGGYYPIKYDPKASMRAETMSEAEEAKRDLDGAYTTATTRRSFTKARVRKVEGRPLLYTLAGMYGGINDVIHDLTWHEWLITANRLMRSNSFDDAVRNRYGPEYVAQLKNWIKDVAAGERGVQNEAEMALNFLRQGISSAGLGFNIVSAAMQITGFNQSIVRLGAGNIRAGVKWMGRGIAYTVTNPMLAMQEVNEKSEFMRNRSRTQFRELNEIRNMVQGQSIAMRRVQMGTYFLMMRMQRMVDVPTWHGAYEKAMHEGRDEETAIALADQAVIDSQGGGMVKDLARVERGGPAVKLFTVFYGYMNTVYNMAAVQTMTNKNKGRLAADYAMLFVVPVVLSYMLKQALIPRKGDEEEEWDMGKIGRELAAEQLSYLMGTMVIAREFGEVGKMIFGVEGPRMGYGGPAGLRAIGETYQFATQASQGEFDRAFRKSAVNMIGAFTGLPSAQVNRTLDGLEALYEGETENVLAPLTGAKKR